MSAPNVARHDPPVLVTAYYRSCIDHKDVFFLAPDARRISEALPSRIADRYKISENDLVCNRWSDSGQNSYAFSFREEAKLSFRDPTGREMTRCFPRNYEFERIRQFLADFVFYCPALSIEFWDAGAEIQDLLAGGSQIEIRFSHSVPPPLTFAYRQKPTADFRLFFDRRASVSDALDRFSQIMETDRSLIKITNSDGETLDESDCLFQDDYSVKPVSAVVTFWYSDRVCSPYGFLFLELPPGTDIGFVRRIVASNLSLPDPELIRLSLRGSELTTTQNWALLETGPRNPIHVELKALFSFSIEGEEWEVPFLETEKVESVISTLKEMRGCEIRELRIWDCLEREVVLQPRTPIGRFADSLITVILPGTSGASPAQSDLPGRDRRPRRQKVFTVHCQDGRQRVVASSLPELRAKLRDASGMTLASDSRKIGDGDPFESLPMNLFCFDEAEPVELVVKFVDRSTKALRLMPAIPLLGVLQDPTVLGQPAGWEGLVWVDGRELPADKLVCAFAFDLNPRVLVAPRWNVYDFHVNSTVFKLELRAGLTYGQLCCDLCERFQFTGDINVWCALGNCRSPGWTLPPLSDNRFCFRFREGNVASQQFHLRLAGSEDELQLIELGLEATVGDLHRRLEERGLRDCRFSQDGRPVLETATASLASCPLRLSALCVEAKSPHIRAPPCLKLAKESSAKAEPPVSPVGAPSASPQPSPAPIEKPRQPPKAATVPLPKPAASQPPVSSGPASSDSLCDLVLPNGDCVSVPLETVADGLQVAMTHFVPDPKKTYAVFSEDDILLDPSTSTVTLKPPILFVSEVIEIPIGDREHPDHVEILQFPTTATVSTVYRRLPGSLVDPKLSSKSGIVLDLKDSLSLVKLDRTDFPLFPLSSASARSITVRDAEETETVLVFDPLVTISDLKTVISLQLSLPPLFQLLNATHSEDPDELLLKDAGTEFMWIDGTAALAGSEPIQIVEPQPEVRPSNGPGAVYRLKWDEDVTEIELGDDQTVEDAKQIYAAKVNVKAEHVSLLFRGKVMRDGQVLSRQRIPAGQEIVVYVRNVREIVLRSNPGRVGPPPDDFEDQVARLVAETGSDKLTCSRCLRFNRYNYDDAVADLREGN
jgi:hypothetical protein